MEVAATISAADGGEVAVPRKPTLHFDITLAPADEPLRARLEDEIDRRWPHRNYSLISTLTVEAGDETRVRIEGRPGRRDSIRRHLRKQLDAWRAGNPNYWSQ